MLKLDSQSLSQNIFKGSLEMYAMQLVTFLTKDAILLKITYE